MKDLWVYKTCGETGLYFEIFSQSYRADKFACRRESTPLLLWHLIYKCTTWRRSFDSTISFQSVAGFFLTNVARKRFRVCIERELRTAPVHAWSTCVPVRAARRAANRSVHAPTLYWTEWGEMEKGGCDKGRKRERQRERARDRETKATKRNVKCEKEGEESRKRNKELRRKEKVVIGRREIRREREKGWG